MERMVVQIAADGGGNSSLPKARERFHPTLSDALNYSAELIGKGGQLSEGRSGGKGCYAPTK